MSKTPTKPTSEADMIAAARKRLQEMVPSAMKTREAPLDQTKSNAVAKKAKRRLDKHKGKK